MALVNIRPIRAPKLLKLSAVQAIKFWKTTDHLVNVKDMKNYRHSSSDQGYQSTPKLKNV